MCIRSRVKLSFAGVPIVVVVVVVVVIVVIVIVVEVVVVSVGDLLIEWLSMIHILLSFSFYVQGVIRLRKRVTLMVVIISIIFAISWGTETIEYVLRHLSTYNIGPVAIAIADTMALLNSAVNPFVYALLNQQFREKIKEMVCCSGFRSVRVHPRKVAQAIALADNITESSTRPTHIP